MLEKIWKDIYFHLDPAMPMGTERVVYLSGKVYAILYPKERMTWGLWKECFWGLNFIMANMGVEFRFFGL